MVDKTGDLGLGKYLFCRFVIGLHVRKHHHIVPVSPALFPYAVADLSCNKPDLLIDVGR